MSFTSYRQESKKDYGTESTAPINQDQLTMGCMLRIADAVEKMAMNHQQLINERDNYKRWYEDEKAEKEFLLKRISSLKGYITKLKNKAK